MSKQAGGIGGALVTLIMVAVVLYGLWSVGELHLITDGTELFFEVFF